MKSIKKGITEEQGIVIIDRLRATVVAEKGEAFADAVIIMAEVRSMLATPSMADMMTMIMESRGQKNTSWKDVALKAVTAMCVHCNIDPKELTAAADKFCEDLDKEICDDTASQPA